MSDRFRCRILYKSDNSSCRTTRTGQTTLAAGLLYLSDISICQTALGVVYYTSQTTLDVGRLELVRQFWLSVCSNCQTTPIGQITPTVRQLQLSDNSNSQTIRTVRQCYKSDNSNSQTMLQVRQL